MVEFAGYALPVQYPSGVKEEHLHTRSNASLFDVSHMGQLKVHGKDRVAFLERVVVGDIANLEVGQATLSLIPNAKGGIMDDTVITKEEDYISMVVNGACKHSDLRHLHQELSSSGLDAQIEHMEDKSLFALQGPKAAAALQTAINCDLAPLYFMRSQPGVEIAGIPCDVTRCGYTGEDGFEISVESSRATELMTALLALDSVKPCGLGARDSLRLEAGLCLYGDDMDEEITPVEATLLWTIPKRRRAEGGFVGADPILAQIANKPDKKRIGLVIDGPPARAAVKLFDESGENEIGRITSGTFSPVLKKPVAMGYVNKANAKVGTVVKAQVRNKMVPATVSKMPFVPHQYYKK